MSNRDIDIPRLFSSSFELLKQYASFVIGVATTYFILAIVPQVYMLMYAPAEPTTESQVVSIVVLLVQLLLSLGFIKIMYFLVDDRPVDIKDLVNNGSTFFSYVVAYFMYMFAVIIGLILLVLPGIYLAIRLMLYPYYIIEHGDHSVEALQKSWYATEGWELELFLFGLCVLLINFAGALLFGFGVIISYPITTMATATVFLGLEDDADQIPSSTFIDE